MSGNNSGLLDAITGLQKLRQSKNAQEIAYQGRLLMEKLDNSRDSFDKVGKHLDSAQTSYSDALKQLFTGRGSLQDKAKKLEDQIWHQ